MELSTHARQEGWDRIVNLYVEISDTNNPNLNANNRDKIIYISNGSAKLKFDNHIVPIVAPALLCFNENDNFSITDSKNMIIKVLYFLPEVLSNKLNSCIIKDAHNSTDPTIIQDALFFDPFYGLDMKPVHLYNLSNEHAVYIDSLIDKIKSELTMQEDGYWPCRSRSYFMELLIFITRLHVNAHENYSKVNNSSDLVDRIIEYLTLNVSQDIRLSQLEKEFVINRNKLNQLFVEKTGLTAMNYLKTIRVSLAVMLLKNTQLPIKEIAYRCGYVDESYFSKSVKKETGFAPSTYRRK